jgi:putative transposase
MYNTDDLAQIESAILKLQSGERVVSVAYGDHKSIKTLRAGIDNYIILYNRRRFHQSLSYKKPMDVYRNSVSNQELMAA